MKEGKRQMMRRERSEGKRKRKGIKTKRQTVYSDSFKGCKL